MADKENDKTLGILEPLEEGVVGRTIPPEQLKVRPDLVKLLADEADSDAFASFIYEVYNITNPQSKK